MSKTNLFRIFSFLGILMCFSSFVLQAQSEKQLTLMLKILPEVAGSQAGICAARFSSEERLHKGCFGCPVWQGPVYDYQLPHLRSGNGSTQRLHIVARC